MARNGSGTYSLPAGQPVVTGTVIDSTVFNTFTADVATALTNSLAKNGETTASANLPMGGFKHTGVADATARTQYASAAQVQDSTLATLGSVAGTDTITATLTPVIVAYATGQRYTFVPANTNTGAATININAVGAKAIVRGGAGAALIAGDIVAGVPATVVYNGTAFYLQSAGSGQAPDGTVALPAYSFSLDPDTGMYRSGSNEIAFSCGGTQKLIINANGNYGVNGTAPLPTWSYISDPDTGMYRVAADQVGVACGGILQARFRGDTMDLYVGGVLTAQIQNGRSYMENAGGAAGPAHSFANDPSTGLYLISTSQLGFSEGGSGFRIGFRSVPRSTTATTLAFADVGKCVAVTAAIAIPISIFSAGDAISIYNDSGSAVNITIAAGTLRLGGTTTTGTRSLAARGMATLWFNVGGATPEVIATGNVT